MLHCHPVAKAYANFCVVIFEKFLKYDRVHQLTNLLRSAEHCTVKTKQTKHTKAHRQYARSESTSMNGSFEGATGKTLVENWF